MRNALGRRGDRRPKPRGRGLERNRRKRALMKFSLQQLSPSVSGVQLRPGAARHRTATANPLQRACLLSLTQISTPCTPFSFHSNCITY
ncbi:MAG: hypothetical protein ACK55Z_23515 [bacterium]